MSQYDVSVTGNVPTNVPINFITNAGTAVSSGNNINVVGGGSTTTSGAGNTVTITTTANVLNWTDEAVSFTAAVNNGYFCTAAGITASLPAAPTQGQVVIIECDTASPVTVQASAGKFLRVGSQISAAAGTAVSSKQGDSIYLVYRSAALTWNSISTEGTWTIT